MGKLRLRTIKLLARAKFIQLGNALRIEGELLKPGIFTGLDGMPTHYSADFIRNNFDTHRFIGQPIKFAHVISHGETPEELPKGSTVGYWTDVKALDKLKVRGYVFDPIAIHYVRTHPHIGLSMEAIIAADYEASLGVEDAKHGKLTGGVLIDDPACPTCVVRTAREVQLEKKMKGVLNVTDDINELLEEVAEFDEKAWDEQFGKEPLFKILEKDGLEEPTRATFFEQMKASLLKNKVDETVANKLIRLMKKAFTFQFEVPLPKNLQDEKKLEGDELWSAIAAKLKGVIPDDLIAKVLEALKGAAKPPATPSIPQLQGIAKELADAKAALKKLTDAKELEQKAELEKVLGEVKELDKDFDVKVLENIECSDAKMTFLQRYRDTLKKTIKPINLQIGNDKAKTTVDAEVESLFGKGVTFEKIFDVRSEAK